MIKLLLNQEEGVTLDLLAETLQVSNRTTYRELSKLEQTLAHYNIQVIRNPNKGYQLVGESASHQALQNDIADSTTELSIRQRQSLLMIQLLLSNYEIKMDRVLLMIGPDPLNKNAQEILGLISASIVESDLNLELFNTASKIMMKNYLDMLFLEHYQNTK